MKRLLSFLRLHRKQEIELVEAVGAGVVARILFAGLAAGVVSASVTSLALWPSASKKPLALSSQGAAFLTRYEGLRTSPYNDPYNCTVGVGHLVHMGPCSRSDYSRYRVTYTQAMSMLMHDVGWASRCVNESARRTLSQPQFDALVDLTFNAGCGGLQRSRALGAVNTGAFSSVPYYLLDYSYASGHYLAGLHTRRVAEGVLFTRGFYGSGIGYFKPPKPKPPVDPRKVPSPVPAWAWRWVEWELGRGPYKGHGQVARLRPKSAPARIPPWGWVFLSRFTSSATR